MSHHVGHRLVYMVMVIAVFLTSCREQQLTQDTNARIVFSSDTVQFDTVFTASGSSTRQVMIYNPNINAIRISRVWWKNGQCFYANIDGENDITRWQDIDILGQDSLFVFIRAQIDPYGISAHPIETDTLFFEINGHHQYLAVQAYGMDVERIKSSASFNDMHLTADKPYLIFDTLTVNGTLTIDAGTTLYMHHNACIEAYGDVIAQGTIVQPIHIQGDRTDYLFDKVPYRVASGQWGGLFLYRLDSLVRGNTTYQLENIHILSGQVGLYCYSDNKDERATLYMHNARVHNMSEYGVVLENTNAELSNVEISNCAGYGLYLAGGLHRVEHSTIANFFGYPYTTINIHSTSRKPVPAVYVLASSSETATSNSSVYNSIITGACQPALVIDSLPEHYMGEIAGCYLRCDSDSLTARWGHDNRYAQTTDTLFKNIYYLYGEYQYYDFHLSPRSAARQTGLPLSSLRLPVANDLDGVSRQHEQPDAGCYSNL